MAYTYVGSFKDPLVSASTWNGSSWTPPIVGVGTPSAFAGLGTRQGIDPLPTGRFQPGAIRINNVKIIRHVRNCTDMNISQWKPHPSWGITLKGPVTASYQMVPESYLSSTFTFDLSVSNYLVQKTLAKISAADFDGGTNLGELRETLGMLKSPLKGVRDLLSKMWGIEKWAKASKLSGGRSKSGVLDDLASARLEFQYGIMPLIRTVESILDLINDGLGVLLLRKLYRKRSSFKRSTGSTVTRAVAFSSLQGTQQIVARADEKYTCGMYYTYSSIPSFQERMGLDLASLPGIAWQLLGLSFVWDWFFGIGNWIESLRKDVHRSIVGSYVSHKVVHTVEASFIPNSVFVAGQPTWRPNGAQSTFTSVIEYLERNRISSTIGATLPAVNPNDLGISRIIDSLALLWQRMPRR